MKELKIRSMTIENFKGVKSLEIEFADKTEISGMNGTGKSTIVDAYCWLLFDKDSNGNASGSDAFRDKPLDDDGNEVHYLDTKVEINCELDGKPFSLARVKRENWVKKVGSVDAVFGGNVSTYYINGVEVKQTEYKKRIAGIVDEKAFRLISSLSEFNRLPMKDKRAQLITMTGADIDTELLAQDEYAGIREECADRNIGIDELKKMKAASLKELHKDMQMNPVRIDEAKRSMPDVSETEIADSEYIIADAKKDIEKLTALIIDAKASGTLGANRALMLEKQQELLTMKRTMMEEHEAGARKRKRAAEEASEEYRMAAKKSADAKTRLAAKQIELDGMKKLQQERREKFAEVRAEEIPEVDTVCPTCGQELPESKIEEAREMLENAKREKLAKIKAEGVETNRLIEKIIAELDALWKEADAAIEAETDANMKREETYKEYREYPRDVKFDDEPRIAVLEEEIRNLEFETSGEQSMDKVAGYELRKRELEDTITKHSAILAKRDAAKATKERIAELEEKQKANVVIEAEIMRDIAVCEKATRDRCALLEAKIDGAFKTVKWKLFNILINGGIEDACVCMIPCGDALVTYDSANTAAQINADIEIVNVLSDFYGIKLPLFIDNAERVNVLEESETQTITLSVSTDKELKIERR